LAADKTSASFKILPWKITFIAEGSALKIGYNFSFNSLTVAF
jgi:hypothetical protein